MKTTGTQICAENQAKAHGGAGNSQMLEVDYKSLVSKADLFFSSPITDGNLGIPLGSGVMGSMVWMPDSENLRLQINRSDVFMQNGASSSGRDVFGACANIKVNFGESMFLPNTTFQHLKYYDGVENINANGVHMNIFAWKGEDVFIINIDDKRQTPKAISIDLSTVFSSLTDTKGNNTVTSTLTHEKDKMILMQVMKEACDTNTTANDFFCTSAVAIDILGTTGAVSSVDSNTLRLSVPAGSSSFTIIISSASSMDRDADVKAEVINLINTAKSIGYSDILASHTNRWHEFWSKSFVYFPEVNGTGYENDYGMHWVNFYYLAGSSFGGSYPAKFNGLLYNTNNGEAQWGAQFWHFNDGRPLYAFETGNHPELLDPFLNMKTLNFSRYQIAAQQQWGSQGMYMEETEAFSGPEILPGNIASELKNSLLNGLGYTPDVLNFRNKRNVLESRWCARPINGFRAGSHTHLVYNTADIANIFWDRYLYTQDMDWLRNRAYPVIKGAAEFYRNFPNLKKGSDNKYHIYRTGFAETVWGGDELLNDYNYIRGVMPTAIKAALLLNTDAHLIPLWQEILDNLADNPLSTDRNALMPRTRPDGKPTYALGHNTYLALRQDKPSVWDEYQIELLDFDQVNLETRARDINTDAWDLNMNTLETQEAYKDYLAGVSPSNKGPDGISWSRFMTDCARMGRSDMVKLGLTSHLAFWKANLHAYPNRMPTEDQKNGVSLQEDAVFAEGMQSALLESLAPGAGSDSPVIYVFPAWPRDIDAAFQLAAKKGFIVTSSLRNQNVEFVEIYSSLGKYCEVNNPWGAGQSVDLYRNGVRTETLSGRLLGFNTAIGENIILVKNGCTPDSYKRTIAVQC